MEFKRFTKEEHETWRTLFLRQAPLRDQQLHPMFSEGLRALQFTPDHIPELSQVNERLKQLSGFEGVPVTGLEDPAHFFALLADRKFPIGNFIRDKQDLSYTPAPDVFHDLYGHIPFFANRDYGDFCHRVGKQALELKHLPNAITQFNRYFWFTIEFALIDTPAGRRIFGAGIASSFGECAYALSDQPEVLPFNLQIIKDQDFRIDEMQKRLFLLKTREQLYTSIDAFTALVKSA